METTAAPQQRTPGAEWRRIGPSVWVGRSDGKPIGMIERGRRFTLTDGDEQVFGGYATLEAAQAAALLPATARSTVAPPARSWRRHLLTGVAGTAGMVTIASATIAVLLAR